MVLTSLAKCHSSFLLSCVIILSGEVFIFNLPWYCDTHILCLMHWAIAILVLNIKTIIVVRCLQIFWLKSPSLVYGIVFLTVWIIGFGGAFN